MRALLFQSAIASLFIAFATAELIDGTKVVGGASLTPGVAFVCGKPAMYLTQSGWQRDDEQDCVKTNEEVLQYCAARYPDMDIVSIVPSQSLVTINSWCNVGETNTCGNTSQSLADADLDDYEGFDEYYGMNRSQLQQVRRTTIFTVRPFRCLPGPFEPDALLIPEKCKFAHMDTFEMDNCSTYESWNSTAAQQCDKTSMDLYSLAILLPCGQPALFAGAEYVCCPRKTVVDNPDEYTLGNYDPLKDDSEPEIVVDDDDEDSEEDCFGEVDYYRLYVTNPAALGRSEHERFEKARRCVMSYYNDRKAALVRDLMDTRFNISDAASRLQVDETFRRLYAEADTMWTNLRRDMNELHQRRVREELRAKSDAAYDELETELEEAADNDPHADMKQIGRVVTAMKSFIASLVREELHWVGRYEFLEEHHQELLTRTREQIKSYLLEIHLRLNRTFELLKRVPEFERPVRERIEKFLAENSDVDNEVKMLFPDGLAPLAVRQLLSRSSTSSTANPSTPLPLYSSSPSTDDVQFDDYASDYSESDDALEEAENSPVDTTTRSASADSAAVDSAVSDAVLDAEHSEDRSSEELNTSDAISLEDYQIESEDDSSLEETSERSQASALRSVADVRETQRDTVELLAHESNWSLLLVVSAFLVGGFLITGAVIGLFIRRRANLREGLRIRTETNVVERDCRRLLEVESERGILGDMQVNGYENPTYTLYDKSLQA